MEFIIITGLSGAGKTRAMHIFEDIGFYCVDNIPPQLISTFYELCKKTEDKLTKRVAVVADVRADSLFDSLIESIDKLKASEKEYKVLFLDATDDILIRRFHESRRKHPLLENHKGSICRSIEFERNILKPLKDRSDYVIDTSFLLPSQLKERISSIFLKNSSLSLSITCMSFGFKYSLPTEADLVFDVRCLPNPYYINELRDLTGNDEMVKNYVLKWEQTIGFIKRLFLLIDYMVPLYCAEGKSQLVIAIGCTGGRHRSVTLTNLLCDHLKKQNLYVNVTHRDIQKK
ncbi:MAG: Nucleotide-binding protein YvcJ [Eubacteriales bacterium SKADARSKE-1]|nr:Nucleotide-binding protein YvcJ [Eubacteriales bacterium SKADARSKE-1]